MKRFTLSIFGYLLLSSSAFALTIVDAVDTAGKTLHAFNACPSADTIPTATCDEAHGGECKMLDYVDAVGADLAEKKWLQYRYLMYLIRRYRDHGLKQKEAEARQRIEALDYHKPDPQQDIQHVDYLDWADQQSAHCLQEHANVTVAQVEKAETLKPAGWFEVPARIALSKARLGDRKGALDLINSLKREFAGPRESQRRWLRNGLENMAVLSTAAELGEYDLAVELAASREFQNDSAIPIIAQIAVRRGNFDQAIRLLANDTVAKMYPDWVQAMAYLGIVHGLVLRGDPARAVTVAEEWNAKLANKGDPGRGLPRMLVHRIIALEMAKRDPLAAMKSVREHDTPKTTEVFAPACSSSVALVGARAGYAEEALQILKANVLQPRPAVRGKPPRPWGEDEHLWEIQRPFSPDELWVATTTIRIKALVEIAVAYRMKGDEAKANAVFNEVIALAETARSENDYFIGDAIARFSPQQAGEFLHDKEFGLRGFQAQQLVNWLLRRGRIAEAVAFYEGLAARRGPDYYTAARFLTQLAFGNVEDAPFHYRQIQILGGITNDEDLGDCSFTARQ